MRVLLDTNIVLDALLQREPWSADAESIWRAHADDRVSAHLAASAVTDIFYVARRLAGRDRAWQAVRTCLDQLSIVAVGGGELHSAAALAERDFEDNVQIACAIAAQLDAIITRDAAGFAGSPVPVLTPSELLQQLATR